MSIAVQYGASVLDGIDPGPVVVRQLFFASLPQSHCLRAVYFRRLFYCGSLASFMFFL
ncbi:Cell division protein FtsW [Enterococcus sp. HSIEG1]|nr:Cell division protein FtsW [Enterococcus sp. HSIEG1]